MTKVEELRDAMVSRNIRGVVTTPDSLHYVSVKELDVLIVAAREEGIEQAREWKREFINIYGPTTNAANGLPVSYGDSLPIKEPPCKS